MIRLVCAPTRSEETTLADCFARAGYATGCFAKWHNGGTLQIGAVTIPKGTHELRVRALEKPGDEVMEIKHVRLKARP